MVQFGCMYVVGLEGEHGCSSNKHRHIICIDDGIADFEVCEFRYEKSDVVEYSVEMAGNTGRYSGLEEIATLPTLEAAYALVEAIIYESAQDENRYAYFDCNTLKIYSSLMEILG